jgi:rubrerythrin
MATNENLKEAFAGESQANRRYIAFAKKADADGKKQVARLFRAAAEAETVHALGHLKVMGAVKGTEDNVKAALSGEEYEYTKMYPQFLKEARAEGNKPAAEFFRWASQVEEVHHNLYGEALKSLQAGQDMPAAQVFVCSVCGNTVLNGAPDICPVCGNPKEKYFEVK